jgi:small GTP-binding protein
LSNETDYSLKICLVGEGGVGKSSLIKRFVYEQFSDKYITTLGTKITKKEVTLKHPKKGKSTNIRMLVWDIMGQQGFRQMLQNAYFFGCQGVVAVCDVTRRDTMVFLEDWIKAVYSISGKVPIVFLGNKCDMKNETEVSLKELVDFTSQFDKSFAFLSSAKTGKNVELGFFTLGEQILKGD